VVLFIHLEFTDNNNLGRALQIGVVV